MEQTDLLRYVVHSLEELGIPYMLVGSFASGVYGEPRMTQDIDFVVDLAADKVKGLCSLFPQNDFYISEATVLAAVKSRGQFNVIHPASGNKIDFMVARNDAWGRSQIERRQRVRLLPEVDGYTARPEDVILSKMDYYREGGSEKHMRDITGMLRVSSELIDRGYIQTWAQRLGLLEIWNAILQRLGQ